MNFNYDPTTRPDNIWFWSDLHFNHVALAEKWRTSADRGFDGTIETHSEVLIEAWNDTVGDNDEVWVLGDAVMGQRPEGLELMRDRLRGRRPVLIPGNHDKNHPMFGRKSNYEDMQALYRETFTVVNPLINGAKAFGPEAEGLILCHFPWSHMPDHDSEGTRNVIAQWGPVQDRYDPCVVVVHGHTHSHIPVGPRTVHVGVDSHVTPISLGDVLELSDIARLIPALTTGPIPVTAHPSAVAE